MVIPEIVFFILLGLLGGFTFVLVEKAESWGGLITFTAFKRYILGGIVGLLYNMGYSSWSLPDGLMCFVSGYAGTTFIESLLHRYEKAKQPAETP